METNSQNPNHSSLGEITGNPNGDRDDAQEATHGTLNVARASIDDSSAQFLGQSLGGNQSPGGVTASLKVSDSPASTEVTQDISTSDTTPVTLQSSILPPETQDTDAPVHFVRSIGAWEKPLLFKAPVTPPEPGTPHDFDPEYLKNQLDSFWPSISDGLLAGQKKKQYQSPAKQLKTLMPNLPVVKLPPPELKEDGSLRFPWAARMSPESRNLYRAAKPTYRLDGTPEVMIPSKVLLLGPENKDEYVVGQFHRCSTPPGGLVHAVVNKLWGRSCKIGCKKVGDSSFMFHIPHAATKQWVIQRGVWHIDDCLLFVAPWNPAGSFKTPEISTLPVWVNLKNIPDCCYSRLGISHIASGLGEPMLTHKPRLDPTSMGEAKILVEVELDKAFPKMIALDDKQGNIFLVEIEYTWIPSMCARCGNLGHKEKRCLLPPNTENSINNKNSLKISDEIPVVDIDQVVNEQNQSSLEKHGHVLQGSYSGELTTQSKDHPPVSETPTKEVCTNFGNIQSKKNTTTTQDNAVGELPIVSQTITQEVTLFAASNSCNSFSPLAGEKSAPVHQSLTMEEVPSNIIVSDSLQASSDDHLICSPSAKTPDKQQPDHDKMSYDHATGFVIGDSSTSFGLTRGGRPIKPAQKFQDMEWHTVGGRGKRGRGRGYRPPN